MKRDLLKRAIPTVLSVFGVGGVFGTAVLAVMATPKAERIIAEKKKEKEAPLTKKEIVKAVWKNYIPAAVIGVSSAICIASANILNRKQINSLNGALAIMAGTYNRYKDKIKELFGDEAHRYHGFERLRVPPDKHRKRLIRRYQNRLSVYIGCSVADFYNYGYSVIVYFHLAGVVMPQNAASERLKHLAYRNHSSSVDYHGIHRQR